MVVIQFDPLSVAEYDEIKIPVLVGGGVLNEVAGKEDPLAVHAADLVAGLQRALIRAAVGEAGDDGAVEAARAGIEDDDEHETEKEVHRRARDENEKGRLGKARGSLDSPSSSPSMAQKPPMGKARSE